MRSARTFPPLRPPLRPSATAAGSFPDIAGLSSASPVARSTISLASWLASRGRLRERSGMTRAYHRSKRRPGCPPGPPAQQEYAEGARPILASAPDASASLATIETISASFVVLCPQAARRANRRHHAESSSVAFHTAGRDPPPRQHRLHRGQQHRIPLPRRWHGWTAAV